MTSNSQDLHKKRFYEIIANHVNSNETKRIRLRNFPVLIGSGENTQLTLRDEGILPTHLRVIVTYAGHVLLSNLGTVGTVTIADKQIPPYIPVHWKPGQIISLGQVNLNLRIVLVNPTEKGNAEKIQSIIVTKEMKRVTNGWEADEPYTNQNEQPKKPSYRKTAFAARGNTALEDSAELDRPQSERTSDTQKRQSPPGNTLIFDSEDSPQSIEDRHSPLAEVNADDTTDNTAKSIKMDIRDISLDGSGGTARNEINPLLAGAIATTSGRLGDSAFETENRTDATAKSDKALSTDSSETGVQLSFTEQHSPIPSDATDMFESIQFPNNLPTKATLPKDWKYARNFAVKTPESPLRIVFDQRIRLNVSITNLKPTPLTVHIAVAGLPRECVEIPPNIAGIQPGIIEVLSFILQISRDVSPVPDQLMLRIYDAEDSSVALSFTIQLRFRQLPNLTGSIEARSGNDFHGATLTLQNHTNVEFSSTLNWYSDNPDFLILLPQVQVTIPSGEATKIPVIFEALSQPWFKPATIHYSISATQPHSAPLDIQGFTILKSRIPTKQLIITLLILIAILMGIWLYYQLGAPS